MPALNGHKRFGDVDVGLFGSVSDEPDYLSADIGGKVAWIEHEIDDWIAARPIVPLKGDATEAA